MKTEFEYKGYWFLPDHPEDKVAGILHYIPNQSIRLELIGGFKAHLSGFLSNNEIKVIHGITSSAKKISLFNCHRRESQNYGVGFPIANYYVQFIFENIHFSDIDDPVFNKVGFQMPLLDKWTEMCAIESNWNCDKNDNYTNITLSYNVNSIKPLKAEINGHVDLEISSSCQISDFKAITSHISIKQEIYCNITSKIAVSNEDLYKQAQLFRFFLSLATKSPIDFEKIIFYGDNLYNEDEKGNKNPLVVSFYYLQENTEIIEEKQYNPLFRYRDIEDDFPQLLHKWFEFAAINYPIIKHLIEGLLPSQYFNERSFLIIAQALDGYHRRSINESPNVGFERRLDEICGKFNEIEKVEKLGNSFRKAEDGISFKDIAEYRHYYSHFFKEEKLLDVHELYQVTKDLRVILCCCVLSEIGFSNELINQLHSFQVFNLD